MDQIAFNEEFRRRTRALALDIIRKVSPLKYSDALGILRKQVVKASTSVASNFRAVCRARSERERYAKLCIVVEEADETDFWIDMIVAAEFISYSDMATCTKEADEIMKVMSAFKKKLEDTYHYK